MGFGWHLGQQGEDIRLAHSHCSDKHDVKCRRQRPLLPTTAQSALALMLGFRPPIFRRDLDSKCDPGQLDPRVGGLTLQCRSSSGGCEVHILDKQERERAG